MTFKEKVYSNLIDIVDPFKGVLLDAYGVFWGGNDAGVSPGAKEVMSHLVSIGKTVGILSNSTQLAARETKKLFAHGLIENEHFHFIVTSGETARSIFLNQKLSFPTPKKKFWLFGGIHPKFSSPLTLFEGSSYSETKDLNEADFIYIAIPHIDGEDQTEPKVFYDEIKKLQKTNLPMVCANPDKFAQEGNPPRAVVRQGVIAALYEELGGKVFYTGKPYDIAYHDAMNLFKQFGLTDHKDIIMVGDNPETDIRGANNFGITACLITQTGLTAEKILSDSNVIQNLPLSDKPHFLIKRLGNIL